MTTTDGETIFSDPQVASLRMLIAGLVLLPFGIKAIRHLQSWKNILLLAIVGFSGNYVPAFLFTYAETGVSSGYAGMLNSFTPIFAIVIGFLVFKHKLNTFQIAGVITGTIGIALLTLSGGDLSMSGDWTHIGSVILATLCYAISLNTIKHTLQHLKSIEITSLAFILTIPASIITTYTSNSINVIQSNEHMSQGLLSIVTLSVIGTAFAVLLFNQLISTASVLFASSVTYLIPIVAMVIGLSFNEKINAFQILSMGVILTGVFIANYLGRRKKVAESPNNKG
jgi:drug/metabolite transporter (DMT)-like permease